MFVRRILLLQTRTCSNQLYSYLLKYKDAKGDSHLPSPANVSNASSLTKTEIKQANRFVRQIALKDDSGEAKSYRLVKHEVHTIVTQQKKEHE